jgi:hypothetical protein
LLAWGVPTTVRTTRPLYDPRLRQIICAARDPHLFPGVVPAGTGRTWISRGPRGIVGNDNALPSEISLHKEVARLRRRLARRQRFPRDSAWRSNETPFAHNVLTRSSADCSVFAADRDGIDGLDGLRGWDPNPLNAKTPPKAGSSVPRDRIELPTRGFSSLRPVWPRPRKARGNAGPRNGGEAHLQQTVELRVRFPRTERNG